MRGCYANFEEMTRQHEKGLSHEDPMVVKDITTSILWMEAFLRTLDHMDKAVYRYV